MAGKNALKNDFRLEKKRGDIFPPLGVASLPKTEFCKAKAHRGTPKGGKMSLPYFSN